MERVDDTKIFGTYIDRTIKIIRHNYTRTFKELQLDITTEQWVVLDSLYKKDGLSQNEIANGSFKNAPTVSRIIDLLCKKGYTKRVASEEDRRRYHIYLTASGKKVYTTALPRVVELRKKGWEGLTDEDYDHFLRIINRVFSNFEE